MATSDGSDLARRRREAAELVAGRPLRTVARQVGLTPIALARFLEGTPPPPAKPRLKPYQRPPGPVPTTDSAMGVLEMLVSGMKPENRKAGIEHMTTRLEECYRAAGHARPPWLLGVRARLRYEARLERERAASEGGDPPATPAT